MYNFQIIIVSNTKLKEALNVAFGDSETVSHFFKTDKEFYLYFFREEGKAIPLPIEMTVEDICPIIQKWLKEEAIYPNHPDMDGSCASNAFKISANGGIKYYNFIKIEPELALYPK